MERRRVHSWPLVRPDQRFFLYAALGLFLAGTALGAVFSVRLAAAVEPDAFALGVSRTVTLMRFCGAIWLRLRWLLLGVLLGMTALGVFTLPVLVLLRGVVFGFSFASLFGAYPLGVLVAEFMALAVLSCAPLVLVCAAGWVSSLSEARGTGAGRQSLAGVCVLTAFSLIASLACAGFELWLLPLFSAVLQ